MVLYDDLFNMRRQFYEESKRQWEEEKQKSLIRIRCSQCANCDLTKKKTNLCCRSCSFFTVPDSSTKSET